MNVMSNQKNKSNPVAYLFGKMWHYSESSRKNIIFSWLLFTVGNIVYLLCQPLLWAKIINKIQLDGVNEANIWSICQLLALTILIELLFWAFHGPGRIIEQTNAFLARLNYRRFLLKGVMTQPLEWHSEYHSGDTIDKVEKGTSALFDFSEDTFEVISTIVQLIVSYIMLAYYCHSSSIIVLIMIVLAIFITVKFDTTLIGQYIRLNRNENEVSASVFDAISNISTIIILRTERLIYNAIIEKCVRPFRLFKQNIVLNEFKWFLTSACCTLMTVVVLGAYFWERILSHQVILIGTVFLLIKYLEKIGDMFFRFANMYAGFLKKKAKVMNSEELTEAFSTESLANHVLPKNWQRLEIQGLNFSYNNGRHDLNLKDVSLSLEKGEKIALVGETGSGKTTLLKVIRDLYHPQSLNLSVDGQNIPDGFGGIARAITLVPQDPEIFATTILENITLGADHEMKKVQHFTDVACFTDVAESLPNKFDSSIKEKGVNLSGGQQQRLALSRGLLACSDKDIVLLDEPTSSIDTANEKRIYQNIFREFAGKTIISSVHRLHLLHLFDKIYMFDKGRIIGAGALGELLESCPEFQTLWRELEEPRV